MKLSRFYIDIKKEQKLLIHHDIIIFMHPFYWYSLPSILKEWIDLVLEHGFAYGEQGTAIKGKKLISVMTVGGSYQSYQPNGMHRFSINELLTPLRQTAFLCGLEYLAPFVVHNATQLSQNEIAHHAKALETLILALRDDKIDFDKTNTLIYLNTDLNAMMKSSDRKIMEYKDFFYQAAIYLLAAVLSVPLAKRLGFGSVLGYLMAGIIIGPFGLAMVGEHSQDIMHFAEFGIVMMLFLIGLELRPALLWQLRSHILGLGLLQIFLTTLAFLGIFLAFGHPFSVSLVIGMILSMSSTAIVMQIYTEKGWIQSPVGQATFSVLLFQDIAVIPMMALIPLLTYSVVATTPEAHSLIAELNNWQQFLVTITIIAAIILAGRFLLRPLLRFIAQAKLREVFTAASLLLVIANALLMQAIGLSPALGTFLAGALMAESEYRHELEADIEPFKGLLLGLFFISVGANINFNILIENPIVIVKLIAVLIVVKAIVLYLIAKIFKFNTQNSLLFSLTLAQGGEFCFVLLSHAVVNQVLDVVLANQVVVAVAMSMILTPLIIIFYEKLLAPYFIRRQEHKEFDTIETKNNPVIIAGFGRYGQIIGRLLIANKIKATVLDLDADNIELIRKFGFKVFYGDASRFDLLQAAGIEQAKLFILAIDDSQKALEIALHVREHYPHLKILARVRGRTQAYDFLNNNFDAVYRETLDSSLAMARDALKILGYPAFHAQRCVRFFRQHDEKSMRQMSKLYTGNDIEKEYINKAKQNRRNLEKAFNADNQDGQFSFDLAWDPENAKERGETF